MSKKQIFLAIVLLLAGSLTLSACNQPATNQADKASEQAVDTSDMLKSRSLIENLPVGQLNENEKQGLIQMREEEKLARDVYQYLYEKWQQPIFNNIARSEQTHTDAVKELLERYKIDDPVKNDSPGVFTSTEMQKLYEELTSAGSQSLAEALKVGATVEDLNIKDLEKFLAQTDNTDIQTVYQNLMKGSRNHLRAFVRNLKQQGIDYRPQYISSEEYEKIISGETEKYQVDAQGRKTDTTASQNNGRGGRGYGKGRGHDYQQ